MINEYRFPLMKMGNCLCVHKCTECNVPYDYYINDEERIRPSCRISRTKHHNFERMLFECE